MKTFYPTKVTQTSGGKFRTFKDLNVIKSTNNGYAESNGNILSKKSSPNRPSTIDATAFNCKLPAGAIVNSITVELKHSKTGDSNKTSCNIGAPTISLINNEKIIHVKTYNLITDYALSKKNQAPKMEADFKQSTFNGKTSTEIITGGVAGGTTTVGVISSNGIKSSNVSSAVTKKVTMNYDLPKRSIVNGSGFGVRINYPTNSNTYPGKIRIWWVRIKVDYTLSSYTLKLSKVAKEGTGCNHEEYHVKLTISRKSKTNYIPIVTITTPAGFSYKGTENPNPNVITTDNVGTVEQIDTHILKYTPALSKEIATSTASVELIFDVNVTYIGDETSVDEYFEATESLNNATATHTAHIEDRPSISNVDDEGNEQIPLNNLEDNTEPSTEDIPFLSVRIGEEITVDFGYTFEGDLAAIEQYLHFKVINLESDTDITSLFNIRYNNNVMPLSDFQIPVESEDEIYLSFTLIPLKNSQGKCVVKVFEYRKDFNYD